VVVLKIAYFVNEYPKVSHSFIRREILAMERQGFIIRRLALRGWRGPLPDAEDRAERDRTDYVLKSGVWSLFLPTLLALARSPGRFLRAARLALKMARESDRPLPYHLVYLAEACKILPWLSSFGAQRVHAHFGTNSAEVVMLARALGGPPYSFTIHGPDEFMQPLGLRDKVHGADFVVAVSDFGRSQIYMRTEYPDWHKIKVVRCGLEKSFYQIDVKPPASPHRLICVGRLCEAKGQMLLLEASSQLAARGIDFELVLAGDGPMRNELEQLIAKLDLGERVRITGWISSEAVRDEILKARALVLPSFAEGLPVVIMEALALRRPVLTTYIAGIPELVRPGEDGWLFAAGSVEDLAAAMQECLAGSPENLQTMGDAGHDRVVLRHSIDAEVAKLAALMRPSET
jgi:colanic acid/amylovoran biosynthesis glycosyltransferase